MLLVEEQKNSICPNKQ